MIEYSPFVWMLPVIPIAIVATLILYILAPFILAWFLCRFVEHDYYSEPIYKYEYDSDGDEHPILVGYEPVRTCYRCGKKEPQAIKT